MGARPAHCPTSLLRACDRDHAAVRRQTKAPRQTMLQMSHGWHMRNPVHIRRDEIASVLGSAEGHNRPEAFTLDVDSQYATFPTMQPEPATLPEYMNWLRTRLAAVAAEFDLLTDPQRIAPTKTTGWCEELAALGRDAEFQALPVARRRAAARARALADAVADPPVSELLQRSGLSPADTAPALLQGLEERTRHDAVPATLCRCPRRAVGEPRPVGAERPDRHAVPCMRHCLRRRCSRRKESVAISHWSMARSAGTVPRRTHPA
jgi:hypothetical protein